MALPRRALRAMPMTEFFLAALLGVPVVVGILHSGDAGRSVDSSSAIHELHECPIEGLAVSTEGRTLASASRDGTVKLWDLESRRSRSVVASSRAGFSSVAFAPDGRLLVSGALDGRVQIGDLDYGTAPRVLSGHLQAVRAVAVSPDGARAVSGGDDRTIRIWSLPEGHEQLVLRGHAGIQGLAFSPDGRTLASAGTDGQVVFWDVESGRIREHFDGGTGALWSLSFSPDGRSLAVGGSGSITVRELASGRSRTWHVDRRIVTCVKYLGDAALVSAGFDGDVIVWDLAGPIARIRSQFRSHPGGVKAMAVSPDGTTIFSGGGDGVLRVWWEAGPTSS